jgi:hypothetical protein
MQQPTTVVSQIVEEISAQAEEHDRTGDLPARGIQAVHDDAVLGAAGRAVLEGTPQ